MQRRFFPAQKPQRSHRHFLARTIAATIIVLPIAAFPQMTVASLLKDRSPSSTVPAQLKAAVKLLHRSVRQSDTGFECRVRSDRVSITDPWSGAIEHILFTRLRVSVEHPRVGRSDPDIYGLRTLLSIRVRGPHDGIAAQEWCVVYSKLVLPERVPQRIWTKVDRLLDAFQILGARIERWRPLEDPSGVDDLQIEGPLFKAPEAMDGKASWSEGAL